MKPRRLEVCDFSSPLAHLLRKVGGRVPALPRASLNFHTGESKGLCGWAKQRPESGGQFYGQWEGVEVCALTPALRTCPIYPATEEKAIYFLIAMALALSHEQAPSHLKAQSPLLPHLAGSLESVLSSKGVTARQQSQSWGLEVLQRPGRGSWARLFCKYQTPRAKAPTSLCSYWV